MDSIQVSNVSITIVDGGRDRLVGWASCTLGDSLRLNNIGIRRSLRSGLMLTYPSKRLSNGHTLAHYHPISQAASLAIEEAIFARLRTLAGDQP